ncbi:hypothetical protein QA640_24365 [Bradyrhizobium sp. CB82]|uniref:hypothetical protein n=1 Tax=Bradyrhizobium sp. CB82 TaxID=3039159 RepID=UPI0024B16BCD|nr:hypothetical protein [Bradyrhizobium sp. CB82]WFU37605.1 hypothetical protein QA640_24365 [Bradyrhizobium sp. CB82]
MPRSPSIVPEDADHDTYIVLDASGIWVGRAWCDNEDDYETLIRDLVDGQHGDPVRIVCFNTTEGWSRVVTTDIAGELRRRWAEGEAMPASLQQLLEMAIPAQKGHFS